MPKKAPPICTDFLVLGAGPAGSTFAARAAAGGANVVLADRGRADVPVVGEFLAAEAVDILLTTGVDPQDFEGIIETAAGITSLWNNEAPLTNSFRARGQRPSVAVDRSGFDNLLAGAATAQGATSITISDFTFSKHKPRLAYLQTENGTQPVQFRRVIDATGRRYAVSRRFGQRAETTGLLVVTAIWFDATGRSDRMLAPLVIETAGNSWWSLTEIPGTHMVTCQYTHKKAWPVRPRLSPDHALATLHLAPYIAARLGRFEAQPVIASTVPAHPQRLGSVFGDDWIAIGDAAAAYDPICGKGTVFAMQSALRAAEAALNDDKADLELYAEAIRTRHDRHLVRRREVYAEAGATGRLTPAFLAALDSKLAI